jgi:hypothetical protein
MHYVDKIFPSWSRYALSAQITLSNQLIFLPRRRFLAGKKDLLLIYWLPGIEKQLNRMHNNNKTDKTFWSRNLGSKSEARSQSYDFGIYNYNALLLCNWKDIFVFQNTLLVVL